MRDKKKNFSKKIKKNRDKKNENGRNLNNCRFKLTYLNKIVLSNLKYTNSILGISLGLMFARKSKVERGICLEIPDRFYKNNKFSSSVTMIFCFYPYDILFLDENYKVVDKVTLKPFQLSYIPKKNAKYIIESTKDKFKEIKLNSKVELTFIK